MHTTIPQPERVERPEDAPVLLSAAQRLAERGRPVFPCGADRRPLVRRGFHDATTEPDAIRRWWTRWPGALIGMPTGGATGVVVVDLDTKNGRDGITAFEALWAGRELPAHPLVRTRSGGLHLYFATVPGRTIRCSASRLASGVDVRGEGGYVIIPPSPGYTLLHRAPLVPPPVWLIELLDPPTASPPAPPPWEQWARRRGGRDEGRVVRRIDGLLRTVANAPEGERNGRLNWAAWKLAAMVAAGVALETEARAALCYAASRCGLPSIEVERTINSAFGAIRRQADAA